MKKAAFFPVLPVLMVVLIGCSESHGPEAFSLLSTNMNTYLGAASARLVNTYDIENTTQLFQIMNEEREKQLAGDYSSAKSKRLYNAAFDMSQYVYYQIQYGLDPVIGNKLKKADYNLKIEKWRETLTR